MRINKCLLKRALGIQTFPGYYLLFKDGDRQRISKKNCIKVGQYLGIYLVKFK